MDELIVRALHGNASTRELEQLGQWRRASASNEQRFREVEAVWRLSAVRAEIDPSARPPSGHEVLGRLARSGRSTRSFAHGWPAKVAGIAAALAVGVLLGRGVLVRAPAEIPSAEFHTGADELGTAALHDGTVVRLGPRTRLEVNIGAGTREVELDGRAFFAVASAEDRAFRVRTAGGEVTVLGTRFEVESRDDGLRLLVLDGRVTVSSRGEAVELREGELARVIRGERTAVIKVSNPAAQLDWMGSFLAFESTPLDKVARELELRLGVDIEIADSAVANRTVTAWFGEQDRDEVVRVICRTAGVQCRAAAGVIHMEVTP
ncbi:MAG: FecR family protein [Longimicrobiales bacterium]